MPSISLYCCTPMTSISGRLVEGQCVLRADGAGLFGSGGFAHDYLIA